MSHETPTISAEPRERTGSRYSQRLRKQRRLPAIIYGHKQDPVAVSVDEKELIDLLHHGAHLLNVKIGSGLTETCLVKDLQFGWLGDNVIHVDFTRVDLDEEVTVNVPLAFKGAPEAAKKPGAILTHALTQLEIICRANAIPDEIVADLSHMTDTLTVGDLQLPVGVRTALDDSSMVAQITFVHEEVVGEEAAVAEQEAEPEVLTEAKPEEEEEEPREPEA